jgi:hypothetical protein
MDSGTEAQQLQIFAGVFMQLIAERLLVDETGACLSNLFWEIGDGCLSGNIK